MIYIIIGIIVFAVGAYSSTQDWGEAVISGLIGSLVGMFVWLLLGSVIGDFLPEREIVTEKPLYALTDTSSTQGSKFLFSGYINEELTYRYIVETERGKHVEEISGEHAYVTEGNYEPHVKICEKTLAKDWYYWFATNACVSETHYEFYVPENTMINNYQIDLE